MRKPPFNNPAFSGSFGTAFGKVFGPESVSEFSPLSIPNLEAWYDADDKNTIIGLFGNVDSWLDKSGKGNTLSGSGSARPITGTEFINGLNAIAFDGVDDFLLNTPFSPSVNFTVAFVFNVVAVNGSGESLISFDDLDAGKDFQIDSNSATDFRCEFNDSLGTSTQIQFPGDIKGQDTAAMFRLSTSDSTVRLFDPSGEIDSSGGYDGLMTNNADFMVGVNRGSAQFLEVNIGEIVIVNAAISDQDRTDLFNYFSNKWGV